MRSRAASPAALVDSWAFFALADRRSIAHSVARTIQRRLIDERWRLVTAPFIVAETHALVLARRNRFEARQVLDQIDRSPTTVIRVEETDELRAREIIDQYDGKDFSLTDAISFAEMERLRTAYAFTFDRHFLQFGFASPGAGDPI